MVYSVTEPQPCATRERQDPQIDQKETKNTHVPTINENTVGTLPDSDRQYTDKESEKHATDTRMNCSYKGLDLSYIQKIVRATLEKDRHPK